MGPFVGGGCSWSIVFAPSDPDVGNDFIDKALIFPKIGMQQANITGTAVNVRVKHRDAHETAAAEQLLSLSAPFIPGTVEEQQVACRVMGLTPSEAAREGASFALEFRGEKTEVTLSTKSAFVAIASTVPYVH